MTTTTTYLHDQRALADGALPALGTTFKVGAGNTDKTLYYVTSAGVIAGGPSYNPAATDVAVVRAGEMGDQEWIRVLNDSSTTIERGQLVVATGAGAPYRVSAAGAVHGATVVGVAQHDIADDVFAWVLRKGPGEVLADGSVTAGSAVEPAASGRITDVGATIDGGQIGVSVDTDAGAGSLVTVILDCRG